MQEINLTGPEGHTATLVFPDGNERPTVQFGDGDVRPLTSVQHANDVLYTLEQVAKYTRD